ncbi:MAG: creatininase [Bacteroides sp. SM1_62]|nr:MAG: creatininase [Bacteroides sp. SM23_62]KPL23692.1 MAG: creatininase [Bacteroides sp. SM1_62]
MSAPGIHSLRVFNRLKVGPAIIEPTRVRARYELTLANGQVVWNELIYSYRDNVFDNSSRSINLASMMLSQVAINYGLFCTEIIFDGLFDETDKRFILDMLENTSREIYVNKFIFANEYIIAPYNQIKAEKHKRYTNAKVSFVNSRFPEEVFHWEYQDTLKDRYVLLSSGGKDSLLSYGLLTELGNDVHPVFINESGRHWFTAINAHNYLKDTNPNTVKVWSNSDRIFNWFLRYMPFIRKDFVKVRADIYPVRLWTVAVFLFGALPVALKEKAGNIIIGNEYDTSMKSSYQGITHYQALYDQSRYFDNALTRYYIKKGWNTYQFSILRSLSEMLIQKILAERYPDLQKQQVSCHAAHIENGRAYPCGKCEKCRRIVALLAALGVSAERCGYTGKQIEDAISKLGKKGVKQLETDASHLYYILSQKKIIDKSDEIARFARPHSHVMKLRFDKERSNLNDMPVQLMRKLVPIYLEYADGAVRRKDKQWTAFDLQSELPRSESYPFEVTGIAHSRYNTKAAFHWESNTWKEMEELLREVDTAILPCGSIEQHGPHLPLDVDYFDSIYLADRVAEACSTPKPFVLPGIPYGVSYHHEDFRGTVSISNQALSSLVYDIGISLVKNGIRKLIILNGHGDNAPTLLYAAQMINRDTGIFVCVESGETSDTDLYGLIETPVDIHAGEIETSTTLAIRPEVVRMDKAVNETLKFGSSYLDYTSERGVAWYVRTKFLSESGIMGDPTKASSEKGKKCWEIMIAHLVKFVEEVKKSKLEDLYQRKY